MTVENSSIGPAICPHLRAVRTQPQSTPPNYVPPYAAYGSELPDTLQQVVTLILGAQARNGSLDYDALDIPVAMLTDPPKGHHAPTHWDICRSVDSEGFDTRSIIAYWSSPELFETWRGASGFDEWWTAEEREEDDNGWMLEIFTPTADRFETIFSAEEDVKGVAHLSGGNKTCPIMEHAYWGSARDRLPLAQVDPAQGELIQTHDSQQQERTRQILLGRVRVQGRNNLCVIRSGQDSSGMVDLTEREIYSSSIEPSLRRGMDYLRDTSARETGCHSCRFMTHLDPITLEPQHDQSFGLAYFDSLASLENWSKSHPTHLDIFGRFLKYVEDRKGDISLKLYHEIYVLRADQQLYEYINCHSETGLLKTRYLDVSV